MTFALFSYNGLPLCFIAEVPKIKKIKNASVNTETNQYNFIKRTLIFWEKIGGSSSLSTTYLTGLYC